LERHSHWKTKMKDMVHFIVPYRHYINFSLHTSRKNTNLAPSFLVI
jgi:hypothetical protein